MEILPAGYLLIQEFKLPAGPISDFDQGRTFDISQDRDVMHQNFVCSALLASFASITASGRFGLW